MFHQEFEPPEELRDSIKCFWYNRRTPGEDEPVFEVIPDGYAEIIFHFGNLSSVSDGNGLQLLPSPFMIGLLNGPVVFRAADSLQIIAVRCFPWTVFDLLGLPSGKDGLRQFEHPIARLQPRLAESIQTGKIAVAVDLLNQFFLDGRNRIATDATLLKAGVAMREANGTLPVTQVAAAAHATVRTLERKFRESSGYAVKDVSGLMRFEQVRNRLWHQPDINLAGLAHELGYADQSHLSREFKRYSGTTPGAFARKTRKGKPVISSNFVAFVQS